MLICPGYRFPILKAMRTDLELSQKIVIATGILFNIARAWGDDEFDEDESDDEDDENESVETGDVRPESVIVTEGDPGSVRVRGQVERERLLNSMN